MQSVSGFWPFMYEATACWISCGIISVIFFASGVCCVPEKLCRFGLGVGHLCTARWISCGIISATFVGPGAFFAKASETFCAGFGHLCRKPRPVGFRVESFLRRFILLRRWRLGPKVWTSEDTSIRLHDFHRKSSPYQMFCFVAG